MYKPKFKVYTYKIIHEKSINAIHYNTHKQCLETKNPIRELLCTKNSRYIHIKRKKSKKITVYIYITNKCNTLQYTHPHKTNTLKPRIPSASFDTKFRKPIGRQQEQKRCDESDELSCETAKKKISQVSALVYLLWKVTEASIFLFFKTSECLPVAADDKYRDVKPCQKFSKVNALVYLL